MLKIRFANTLMKLKSQQYFLKGDLKKLVIVP
jgi:hypothetical protein